MKGIIIPLTEEEFEAHLEAAFQKVLDNYDPPKDDVEYLTRKEVAKKLRISLPTLHTNVRKRILNPHRISGRVLFRKDEIDALLASGQSIKYRRK
ncbi:helix-turn-helix domain-containing protein [uncultured Draconibacterium sp.]|uniref:helix-turn-helix domain-containing protein n=1 Tax=uncultured Draconibacterium sp. TaxID=1573823 RepID=UPI0025E666A7|nr:helix-turn-helix domain-containing protein [uncultured Draconibacterium sp.]